MSAAGSVMMYQEPGKVPSVVLALLVHLVLALFLSFGVRWQSRHAEAVEVELWASLPAPALEPAVAQPEPVPEIKPAPAPEAKPEPKVEKAVEPPKPDIALKKELKNKKELKKEPPTKLGPRLDLDRSLDMRAQADLETAQLAQGRIRDQISREAAAATSKSKAEWVSAIIRKIKPNVVKPDILGNPEAIFEVTQLPTGEVLKVNLRKSSGYPNYDQALERAILKSSPLPRPASPELFERSLELKFRPQDS